MLIFPAIDLYEGKAVRLLRGDYAQMTVYDENPLNCVKAFVEAGAKALHLVDLEGAKKGRLAQLDLVRRIKEESGLFCQLGGGIRDKETIKACLAAGLDRIILGTAAVNNSVFLQEVLEILGDRLAVSVDIRDGYVATHAWQEQSTIPAEDFFFELSRLGVRTLIVTDISRDGAMRGSNLELYRDLSSRYALQFIASGGVSGIEDIKSLRDMDLYGAIIGKAYYSGALSIEEAIRIAG
jgi:phosphoribosylformimino-5-aminoimidazole carboxamide ribotide isomerase